MKARCNDSIKRLITSTEYHFDDGMTVDQRFNSIPSAFQMPKVIEMEHSNPLRNALSQPLVPIEQYAVPFGVVVDVPKGFDRSKSSSHQIDIVLQPSQQIHYVKKAIEEFDEMIDWSTVHNNLEESIMVGRAVYSWVQQMKSCTFTRETESHLPNGEYGILIYVALITKFQGNVSSVSWADRPMHVKLTVVSKKAGKKTSKKKSTDVDPEETVESLLAEYDNII